MATDILFPFYDILVNSIFGSVAMSILAIAAVITLILMLGRTSWTLISFWLIFYFTVMGTMYIGAFALVLFFLLTGIYTIYSFMRLIASRALNV